MFLNCILSKNIILTIMDLKVSDTNRGKRNLLHNGCSYGTDAVLKSADIFFGGVPIRNVKVVSEQKSAIRTTMVESRYHNFGLDSEIYLKPLKTQLGICLQDSLI